MTKAAIETKCQTLLTEDLQNGRVVQGVSIQNPFVGERWGEGETAVLQQEGIATRRSQGWHLSGW